MHRHRLPGTSHSPAHISESTGHSLLQVIGGHEYQPEAYRKKRDDFAGLPESIGGEERCLLFVMMSLLLTDEKLLVGKALVQTVNSD